MLYYYANTGHKRGLERLRRGAALLNRLSEKGYEVQLLVNDFRAGLAAKELGVKEYVTIETIQDIDAIAMSGDSIIIDSAEDDHGRLVKYCADFSNVWRFEHDSEDKSVHGEILFRTDCKNQECADAVIIGDEYFESKERDERSLFFLGDDDYDKVLLKNEAFFKTFDMELLLGNYFFVKYEDDLAKIFSTLHEPEEYTELIKTSGTVVTSSAQTALEVKASGGKAIFLNILANPLYPVSYLSDFGIEIVEGFDVKKLTKCLENNTIQDEKQIEKFDDTKIVSKL